MVTELNIAHEHFTLTSKIIFGISLISSAHVIISIGEGFFLKKKNKNDFKWKELFTSLIIKIMQLSLFKLLPFGGYVYVHLLVWSVTASYTHIFSQNTSITYTFFLVLLVTQDFLYYWGHRISHLVRCLWASHIVHHSTTQMSLSASFRDSWLIGPTLGITTFYLPLSIIGIHPLITFSLHAINITYQFWIHNSWMPKLGPLEYILNTPSLHRVHHARNPEYINANFGGILIVFDIIFGTYKAEKKSLPCDYGLSKQMNSHNPFYIELREWSYIFHDLKKIKKPVDLIKTLLFIPK